MACKHEEIEIIVWDDNDCDELIEIIDSNGFSLDVLNRIHSDLQTNDLFDEYKGNELIVKVKYNHGQIGNYPPPNIEIPPHWEYDIIKVKKW